MTDLRTLAGTKHRLVDQHTEKIIGKQLGLQGVNIMSILSRAILLTSTAGIALTYGSSASAQEAGTQQATAPNSIVVTARKKEESILDAPVAITAFSAEDLEAADITSISEVADATPGLYIDAYQFYPGRFDSTPFIRGVVIEDDDPTFQTASVFLDGVYVAGGTKGLGVEDVERIEVIKGPQSALFGRTTFSGAINYITKDPASEFSGKISATAATRDEYEGVISIEGPIAGDALRARVTGRYSHNGGHWENTAVPGQKLGEESTWSVGATVVAEPSPDFYLKVRAFYYEDDDGPAASFVFNRSFNNFNVPPVRPLISTISGEIPQVQPSQIGQNTSQADLDRLLTIFNASPSPILGGLSIEETGFGLNREAGRFTAQATIGLSDTIDFDVNAGYAFESVLLISDYDGSPANQTVTLNNRDFEDVSIEARLSGTSFGDRLGWSIGGSYFNLDYQDTNRFLVFNFGPNPFFFNSGAPNQALIDTYGIFAQLDLAITDQLSVTAEGRYAVDEIDGFANNGVQIAGSPQTFKNFLPRVTINFEPSPDTLLYASYSVGNLPGGFNPQVAALDATQRASLATVEPNLGESFGEEELTNYEIGWKQSIGNAASLALSAFYMDRVDQQVTSAFRFPDDTTPSGTRLILAKQNLQTSEIKGFEFEGTWSPVDMLRLRGTLAYTDAEIKSFPPDGDAGEFEDVFGPDADPEGQKAPIYPEWQASFSATISDDLGMNWVGGAAADWYIRGDVYYRGEYFVSVSNLGNTPDSIVANLRAGIDSDTLGIEAFVTNLFNEDAYTAASTIRDPGNFVDDAHSVGLRDKRQFGVRTTMRF